MKATTIVSTYVNKEIDDDQRQRSPSRSSSSKGAPAGASATQRAPMDEKKLKKELKAIQKTVVSLDQKRKEVNELLMQATDPAEALRLHNELKAVEMELGEAEQRWLELSAME